MMDKVEDYLNEHGQHLMLKAGYGIDKWYEKVGRADAQNIEVLAVEKEVYLTLPNGFKMTCRLDRLLRDKDTGEVFICDTKTTSWSLDSTLRNYEYHDQPKLYFMAAKETFPEIMKDCRGWRTDGIYMKQQVSKGVKQDFFYTDAKRSNLISFRDEDLEDVKNSYSTYIDDMTYKLESVEIDKEPISLHFPKCGEACLAFNRVCEYYPICNQINSIKQPGGDYIIDPWVAAGTVLNQFRQFYAKGE